MLRQRIVTAVVLLAFLLPAMWAARPEPFAILTLAFVAAAAWEWSRLNGLGGAPAIGTALVVAGLGLAAWQAGWSRNPHPSAWAGLAAMWVVAGGLALWRGVAGWGTLPKVSRLLLGVVILWAAWLAIVSARGLGLNFLLSTLCLVWVADIAAYFGGHRYGRRKLAPQISPGKTWEGAVSGWIGVLALAALWVGVIERLLPVDGPSLYGRLLGSFGVTGLAIAASALCAMSVVGDLFESLLKRSAGMKDSSGLLPGHGGVLDRIDALLPVFPIAMALVTWQGARA
ncbi:MAG: phosphatidate cytidylyltransferase [Rubrivivax sp.]